MRASSLPCVRLMFALCRFAEPELDLLLCLGVQHAQRLAQLSLFQWLLTVSPASSLGAMLIFATLANSQQSTVNSQQSEKSLFWRSLVQKRRISACCTALTTQQPCPSCGAHCIWWLPPACRSRCAAALRPPGSGAQAPSCPASGATSTRLPDRAPVLQPLHHTW